MDAEQRVPSDHMRGKPVTKPNSIPERVTKLEEQMTDVSRKAGEAIVDTVRQASVAPCGRCKK